MKNLKDYIVSLNPYNIFIMIKPEFLKKAKAILDIFLNDGYTIAKYGCRRLSYEEAAELYKMHKDEPYYDELCKYTCSGLSIGYCLNYTGTEEQWNAISKGTSWKSGTTVNVIYNYKPE